jgi:hypothetical protein
MTRCKLYRNETTRCISFDESHCSETLVQVYRKSYCASDSEYLTRLPKGVR